MYYYIHGITIYTNKQRNKSNTYNIKAMIYNHKLFLYQYIYSCGRQYKSNIYNIKSILNRLWFTGKQMHDQFNTYIIISTYPKEHL